MKPNRMRMIYLTGLMLVVTVGFVGCKTAVMPLTTAPPPVMPEIGIACNCKEPCSRTGATKAAPRLPGIQKRYLEKVLAALRIGAEPTHVIV